MGRLFGLITGVLGLVADIISIAVFFFTAPPVPHSSSYIIEDVVIAFVMFYGWVIISAAMIYGAIQKEPWRSKVRRGYSLFGGSPKVSLSMLSTFSIGLFIWPIMVAFVAMLCQQIPNVDSSTIVTECIVAPIFIIFVIGAMLGFAQSMFMALFIGE